MMPTTSVLVVDDHPIVQEGVIAVLSSEPDVAVVGRASNADEMFAEVERLEPDVIVLDVRIPGMDGIDACATLIQRRPHLRVLILTRFPSESMMLRAFSAGAKGFLIKESNPDILRQAVRTVAAGQTFVDPQVAAKLVTLATKGRRARGPFGLTVQEMRVVELLPRGLTNKAIGHELGVSESTVKTHLRHAMRKMQASDRTEAAAIAMREGLA